MKKVTLYLLILAILATGSCKKDESNTETYEGAAIVKEEDGKLFINPAIHDKWFLIHELPNQPLFDGNLIWIAYYVDFNTQITRDYVEISYYDYFRIYSSEPVETPGGISLSGQHNVPLNGMTINSSFGAILVFMFEQTARAGESFDYEMTYAPEMTDEDNIPTLFVRARIYGSGSGTEVTLLVPFAFDMTSLAQKYIDETTNTMNFKVQYLSDNDEVFSAFVSSNDSEIVTWKIGW